MYIWDYRLYCRLGLLQGGSRSLLRAGGAGAMGPPSRQNGSGGGKIKEHKGKDARAEAQLATRVQEMEYLRKRVAEEAPAPGMCVGKSAKMLVHC